MNRTQTHRLAIDTNVRAGGFKPAGEYFEGWTGSASSLGALESACGSLGGTFSAGGSITTGWRYVCSK